MYGELLRSCGLTENESLVYLALLKLGKSKSGEVVREAKVSGGKIYETLYKLVDKGVVKMVLENNVKHFIANSPETLVSYLEKKEKEISFKKNELTKVLPQLSDLQKQDLRLELVSMIKGVRGISPIVNESLKKGNKILIMGVRSSKNVKYNNFWRNWHRERINLKKKARLLFADKDTSYWNFFKKQKFTEIKALQGLSPSAIMVIDNESFIFSYEKEFTCVHIKSKEISSSFETFFNSLWKIGEK